jgi:hypothetical protein
MSEGVAVIRDKEYHRLHTGQEASKKSTFFIQSSRSVLTSELGIITQK